MPEVAGGFELDDDRDRIDFEVVFGYISGESYWAKGRTREQMETILAGSSRVIGLYAPDGSQAGFARVVSDNAYFSYLADVFVLEEFRGRGLGVELVREAVEREPWASTRWVLGTYDAHSLYERFGFTRPGDDLLERPRRA